MHTHTSLVITEAPSIRNDSASWIIIKWNHHLHALHKQTHRIASTIIYGSPEPHTQKKKKLKTTGCCCSVRDSQHILEARMSLNENQQ